MNQSDFREPEPVAAELTALHGEGPDEWILHVRGEIDVATSPALRAEIGTLIDGGAQKIVLDLHEMSFIDSSGLGVLVGALKRLRELGREDLTLLGLQGPAQRVFEITGLTQLFPITD